MDEADYIKEQYFLEVSSPGLERVLKKDKHLEKNIGSNIEVKLFKKVEDQKQFEGILMKFDKENIYIQTITGEKVIERKNVAQAKTKYNWERKD